MPNERAYADVIGNFRRGAGRSYAAQGRYQDAIEMDDANAGLYAGLESRARENKDRARSTAIGGAVARGDYDTAARTAAEGGDLQTMGAVNELRARFDNDEARSRLRQADQWASDLEGFVPLGAGAWDAPYAEWRTRAAAASAARGDDPAEFEREFPQMFTPRLAQAARAEVDTLLHALLTPEEIVTLRRNEAQALRDERRLEIQDRQADISERRAAASELTAQAAMLRAERAGGGGGVSDAATFTRANTLRDEYNQQTQSYRTIADIARRSEEYVARVARDPGATSGQADVGLVYALAKIYDPTSVVREGEFATMARQGGYGEQMQSWVNQALGQGFSTTIRNQIMAEIRNGVRAQEAQRNQTRTRYEGLAGRAGIDPSMVIDDYGAAPAAPGGGLTSSASGRPGQGMVRVTSQAQYDGLPSGTAYVDSQGNQGVKP